MVWGLLLTAACVLVVMACSAWQIRRVDGIVEAVDRRLQRQEEAETGGREPAP